MSTLENKYILSPLESILINKQMPKGYKLETEENLSNNISKLNEYIDKNYKSIMSLVINENLEKALKTENNTPMTLDEKKALGENIGKLNIEELKGIIKIIQNHTVRDKKVKYLEFDIDKLSVKKCRELESYVRACLGNQYNEVLKNNNGDD